MLSFLTEYAAARGLTAEPGFKKDHVRWLLRFDAGGEYLGAVRQEKNGKNGSLFTLPRLSQPEMKAGGAGTRHFLCDDANVVALLVKEGEEPDDKLLAKNVFYLATLREAAAAVPELAAVADRLADPEQAARVRADLSGRTPAAKPTDTVSLAVAGRSPENLLEDDAWRDWYRAWRTRFRKPPKPARAKRGKAACAPPTPLSLTDGRPVTPAKTQPKIAGLAGVGGLSMGNAWASFKQDSFRHHGWEQAENAPVSEEQAATYRAALNELIREARPLAGSLVAHWYAGPVPPAADPIPYLQDPAESEFGLFAVAPEPDGAEPPDAEDGGGDGPDPRVAADAVGRARRVLDAIGDGGELADLAGRRFFALTLAANSGRVVVRDWMQGDFAALVAAAEDWFADLRIARLDRPGFAAPPKLEGVLTCVLPPKPSGTNYGDWVKPVGKLREPLWRAAAAARCVPEEAVRMLLTDWRAAVLGARFSSRDQNHAEKRTSPTVRAALLKLFLLRKGHPVDPELTEDHPNPAYHLGRLLAVLDDVQRTALGDVGTGVVQRYYARASTAPADAIGPLIRLSNHHLDKIGGGLAVTLRGRIADVFGRCRFENGEPPATLSTVEETLFALGFYQQIARDRAARKRAKGGEESPDTTPDTSEEE